MLTTGRPGGLLRLGLLVAAPLLLLPPPPAFADEPVARPVTTELTVAATTVTHGEQVAVTARLTDADGAPVVGVAVELVQTTVGARGGRPFRRARTSADGAVTGLLTAVRHVDVAVRSGTPFGGRPVDSRPVRVLVRPVLTAQGPGSAGAGTPVVLRGALAPARPGRTVVLERKEAGTWRKVATTTLSPASTWAFRVVPTTPGPLLHRVSVAAASDLTAATTALPSLTVLPVWTYSVVSRGVVTVDVTAFAGSVAETYADPRGWSRSGRGFRRVASGGDFTVVLAEARLLPTFSSSCSVRYSCRVGRLVIVNQDRWRSGSAPFPGPLAQYRQMVVNHETGHWLGLAHGSCSGAGRAAPVMQQQSKGLQGCAPNAWPSAAEVARARR